MFGFLTFISRNFDSVSSEEIHLTGAGVTLWKARNSSGGSSTTDSQTSKTVADVYPSDARPSRSFRNFRFDTGPILQAVDAAFST